MKRIIAIPLLFLFLLSTITLPAAAQTGYVTPSFSIVDVVPGQSVTIWTTALSPNDNIQVTMGNFGTGGIGGALVGTFNSGAGGQLTLTFNIPPALRNAYQIDIRLQSTISGLSSTNWFYNNTASPYYPYYPPPTYPTPYPPYNPYYPPYSPYQPYYPYPPFPSQRVTPTISILNVIQDTSVTFTTNNFPANRTFNVRMGPIGSMGINGILAGSFYSAAGGSQIVTIPIPPSLRGSAQIAIRCESTTGGYYAYDWFYNSNSGQYYPPYPPIPPYPPYGSFSFSILSVIPDQSVTIQTSNFPANQTFYVRMGPAGTQGIGGILVDTVNSSSGGIMVLTFYIPSSLRGYQQIDLRLESPSSGISAYNTFTNQGIGPYPTPYPPGPYNPTVTVTNVVRDISVTLQAYNFPPSTTYNVLMGYPGTYYQSGFTAGTLNTGPGGSFSATLNIPAQLQGANEILLWLVNAVSGELTASTSFNNQGWGPFPSPYSGIPTFTITNVVRDSTVTILTNNFPPNDTFNVRMGPMGSQGIGGIIVGTVNSGAGGSFSATFNIPPSLYGSYQIAIRLESPTSGYYAYNWFYNNTTP